MEEPKTPPSAARTRPLLKAAGWTLAACLAAGLVVVEVWLWPAALQERLRRAETQQEEMSRQVAELRRMLAGARQGVPAGPGETYFFRVYGPDRERRREEVAFTVAIPDEMPLLEKLGVLAEKLSEYQFGGLPVTVRKITQYGGRNVAVIDLQEPQDTSRGSWKTTWFENRVNGYFAGAILKKTFLQDGYRGAWVDGIEFLYNGQPFFNDWPNVALSGTILRAAAP